MTELLDRTIVINAFSLIDFLALLISTPVLVVSAIRFARVTRNEMDLAFTIAILGVVVAAMMIIALDNVVPVGTPAESVRDGGTFSLLVTRWIYLLGLFVQAATVHFALRYTNSQRLLRWRALWLYGGVLALTPLIWSSRFVTATEHPRSVTSGWRIAVPWLPVAGDLIWTYAVLSLAAVLSVQYLIWLAPHGEDLPQRSAAVRSATVRIGLTVICLSVTVLIVEALIGYLGIDFAPFITSVGMVVVGLGLCFEWELSTREHEHVTQRFQSYVDPSLVKYVLNHPEKVRFEGEVRELTVAFTDLEGYTQLAEKLRAQAVPMLNEYFSLLTPLIHEHNGYRSKFLGDGIMFFYGAPEWNCDHAMQAVATVLKMQETLFEFNQRLLERGMQPLVTRIGVSSGEMIVGDAGSNDASDYTVFGDMVNLGARLESANKAMGTQILISEGTYRLLPPDLFLVRPIGKLRVVGLSNPVMTYEPIAYTDKATEAQRKLAELTKQMVEAFVGGDFPGCLAAEQRLTEAIGPSKLAALYRSLGETYRARPPGQDFAGQIVLTSK